ncbi:hypothetical protein, partial [Streptomyces sp. NPDC004976]
MVTPRAPCGPAAQALPVGGERADRFGRLERVAPGELAEEPFGAGLLARARQPADDPLRRSGT